MTTNNDFSESIYIDHKCPKKTSMQLLAHYDNFFIKFYKLMIFFSDVDTNESVQNPQGSTEETEKMIEQILEFVINRVVRSDETIADMDRKEGAGKIVEH
jgi:hypothetical protein